MAKKQINFRLDEEISDKLKIYAIENKTSVQELLEKYVLNLLRKKGESSQGH